MPISAMANELLWHFLPFFLLFAMLPLLYYGDRPLCAMLVGSGPVRCSRQLISSQLAVSEN